MLAMRLCVIHNLYFFNNMMEEIRSAIENQTFNQYKSMRLEGFKTAENDKIIFKRKR